MGISLSESFRRFESGVAGFFAVAAIGGLSGCAASVRHERVVTLDERLRCQKSLDGTRRSLGVMEAVFSSTPGDLSREVLERVVASLEMSTDEIDGNCRGPLADDPGIASEVMEVRARSEKLIDAALREKRMKARR